MFKKGSMRESQTSEVGGGNGSMGYFIGFSADVLRTFFLLYFTFVLMDTRYSVRCVCIQLIGTQP